MCKFDSNKTISQINKTFSLALKSWSTILATEYNFYYPSDLTVECKQQLFNYFYHNVKFKLGNLNFKHIFYTSYDQVRGEQLSLLALINNHVYKNVNTPYGLYDEEFKTVSQLIWESWTISLYNVGLLNHLTLPYASDALYEITLTRSNAEPFKHDTIEKVIRPSTTTFHRLIQ